MPNLSDSSSDENTDTRDDVVQLFASDSEVDVSIHDNERPQMRRAASANHATSSQSGGPGKGKGNKKGKSLAK